MSEISIIVPFSVLSAGMSGEQDFSPEGIIQEIARLSEYKRQIAELKSALESLLGTYRSTGRSLQLILDEVDSPIERARALRQLAKEMQDMK